MFAGMARGWKNLACKAQSTENAAKTEFQFVRFEPKLQLGWMFFDISLLLASFIRLFVYSLTFQPFFLWLPFPRSAAKTNLQRSFLILILHITPYQTVFCFQTPFFFYSTSFVGKTLLPKKHYYYSTKS